MKLNENCAFGFGKYFSIIKLLRHRNKLKSVTPTISLQPVSPLPFMRFVIEKYFTIIKLIRVINKRASITLITYNSSLITCICICLASLSLSAQTYNANPDLGNIKGNIKAKLKDPFKINGGFALNSVYVNNTGLGATNPQPFTWIATANLNLSLFGYALPFSFTYSNRKVQYTNPSFKFNRFVLHPKNKS